MNLKILLAFVVSFATFAGHAESGVIQSSAGQTQETIESLPDGVRVGSFDLRGIRTWGEFMDRFPQVDIILKPVTWRTFGGVWYLDALVRDKNSREELFIAACSCARPDGRKGRTVYFNGKNTRGDRIEVSTFREAEFNVGWVATRNSRYRTSKGIAVGSALGDLASAYGKVWVMLDLNFSSPFESDADVVGGGPTRYEVACLPRKMNTPNGDVDFGFILEPPKGELTAGIYGKKLAPGEFRTTRILTDKFRHNSKIEMITSTNRCLDQFQ